ncbi:MAG: hypothetical protein D4R88_08525 [Methanosarcinales archaeon]|nr:MAG: hypothetical protein D4R88_08525 [Methanosarcinales archaeon]
MAEKKAITVKPDEKVTMLAKTEKLKAMAVKEPSQVQAAPKPEEKAIQAKPAKTEAPGFEVKAVKEAIKAPAPEVAKTPETPKAEAKAEVKKEADPSKEFVDGIMAEMALKGASKKRLIKMLAEQYGMDKQKVMFRLKRALITERYAAAHEAAGH